MASISLLVLDFLLSVLIVFCGGYAAFTARNGVVISSGNVFAVILMVLLFLQVMHIIG